MRSHPVLVALCIFVASTGAQAQWSDSSGETDCAFEREYTDGTDLEFGINRSYDYGTLITWNDKWRSIREGAEYQIDIKADGVPFGTFTGKGMRTSQGSGGLFIVIDGRETLRRLTAHSVMELHTKGRLIGRYSLSGAAREMTAALRCASEGESEDPFSI